MVLRRRPVVAALRGGCLHFWDLNAGKQAKERTHPHRPRAWAFSYGAAAIAATAEVALFEARKALQASKADVVPLRFASPNEQRSRLVALRSGARETT